MTEQTNNDTGFFNDLADVELGIKDGPYPAYVRKSEIVTKKDGTKAWVVTYSVANGPSKGEQIPEWFNTYPNDPEKNANARKWRARRLASLGVPESKWSTFSPDDVIGTPVIIKVKTNDSGFLNVQAVTLADENTWKPLGAGSTSDSTAAITSVSTPSVPRQEDVSNLL